MRTEGSGKSEWLTDISSVTARWGGGEVRETSSEFFLQEEQAIIGHINMQWPVLDAS